MGWRGDRNVVSEPLAPIEEEFINVKILHLKAAYEALKDGMSVDKNGVAKDVREIFGLPAVAAAWKENKRYYESKFISFIDGCLAK